MASFPGSPDYQPTAAQVTFSITRHATTIAVSSSNPTAAPGQPVTFSASVLGGLPAPYLPTGSVQFQLNGQNVGTPVTIGRGWHGHLYHRRAGSQLVHPRGGLLRRYRLRGRHVATRHPDRPGARRLRRRTRRFIVGANTADYAQVSPAGCKSDGNTGLQVNATLNNVYRSKTFNQTFTAIAVFGYGGNDDIPAHRQPDTADHRRRGQRK